MPKRANGCAQTGKPIPDIIPDTYSYKRVGATRALSEEEVSVRVEKLYQEAKDFLTLLAATDTNKKMFRTVVKNLTTDEALDFVKWLAAGSTNGEDPEGLFTNRLKDVDKRIFEYKAWTKVHAA